jgi:hypothetical protein
LLIPVFQSSPPELDLSSITPKPLVPCIFPTRAPCAPHFPGVADSSHPSETRDDTSKPSASPGRRRADGHGGGGDRELRQWAPRDAAGAGGRAEAARACQPQLRRPPLLARDLHQRPDHVSPSAPCLLPLRLRCAYLVAAAVLARSVRATWLGWLLLVCRSASMIDGNHG